MRFTEKLFWTALIFVSSSIETFGNTVMPESCPNTIDRWGGTNHMSQRPKIQTYHISLCPPKEVISLWQNTKAGSSQREPSTVLEISWPPPICWASPLSKSTKAICTNHPGIQHCL